MSPDSSSGSVASRGPKPTPLLSLSRLMGKPLSSSTWPYSSARVTDSEKLAAPSLIVGLAPVGATGEAAAAGLAAGLGLAAADGEGLAAAAGLGLAGAADVGAGGAAVGLGPPPVVHALSDRASAASDAPAASRRKLRIGSLLWRPVDRGM